MQNWTPCCWVLKTWYGGGGGGGGGRCCRVVVVVLSMSCCRVLTLFLLFFFAALATTDGRNQWHDAHAHGWRQPFRQSPRWQSVGGGHFTHGGHNGQCHGECDGECHGECDGECDGHVTHGECPRQCLYLGEWFHGVVEWSKGFTGGAKHDTGGVGTDGGVPRGRDAIDQRRWPYRQMFCELPRGKTRPRHGTL